MAKALKGSKTHDNLKPRSPASRRRTDAISISPRKPTSKGRTTSRRCFAHRRRRDLVRDGHLEYLEQVGDPATNLPIGRTQREPESRGGRRDARVHRHVSGMAKQARDEGFGEIADWFETLAKAERSHANRFQKALDALAD